MLWYNLFLKFSNGNVFFVLVDRFFCILGIFSSLCSCLKKGMKNLFFFFLIKRCLLFIFFNICFVFNLIDIGFIYLRCFRKKFLCKCLVFSFRNILSLNILLWFIVWKKFFGIFVDKCCLIIEFWCCSIFFVEFIILLSVFLDRLCLVFNFNKNNVLDFCVFL